MTINRPLIIISSLLLFLNLSFSQQPADKARFTRENRSDIPFRQNTERPDRLSYKPELITGNSERMTGTVSVAVFFVESNGTIDPNNYSWTSNDEDTIINQIQTALNWWSAEALKYNRTLSFQISSFSGTDMRCRQGYEPIMHQYVEKNLWLDPIMNNFGYTTGSTLNKINNFNSNLRTLNNTDHAFSIFVCYNPAPAATTFTDGFSIVSFYYGPYMHLLLRNGSTSINDNHNIIANGVGIIFGGLEECDNCNQSESSKSISNTNCEKTPSGQMNTTSVDCIMKNRLVQSGVCSFTAAHIGWIDIPVLHTISSSPPGLRVLTSRTGATGTEVNFTPKSFGWGPGQIVNLKTDSLQNLNSVNYSFTSWSDNGLNSHNIIISDTDDTITAVFTSPPNAPVLSYPLNDTQNCSSTQTFTWIPVTSANTYRIQLSNDSSFTTIFYDENNITTTSRIINGLLNGTTYYWRVNAANASGAGAWSSIRNFTTQIDVPLLTYPINNSTGVSILPEFTWSSIYGAVFYKIQLSTDNTFSTILFEKDTLSNRFTFPVNFSKNVKYYWRVKTFSLKGMSQWSSVWSFTTVNTTATCFCNTDKISIDTIGFLSPDKDYFINLSNTSTSDNLLITSLFLDQETSVIRILDNYPITIYPGGSYTLSIRIHPDSVGKYSNNLHILNSSNNNSHIILPVSGFIVGTRITVTPLQIDFGNIGYRADLKDTMIIVTNTGDFPLKIDSINFRDNTNYQLSTSFDYTKFYLNPKDHLSITIRLNPLRMGINNNELLFSNNSSNIPSAKITLSHNVVPPALLFSPDTIFFDTTSLQLPDIKKTFTIYNSSEKKINIINYYITGDSASFSISTGINRPCLLQRESDSLVIKFSPVSKGFKNAVLKINSDDLLLPSKKIYLIGFGGGRSIFSHDQKQIDFGNIPAGETIKRNLYFKNTGNLNLEILGKSITGKDKDIFNIIATHPFLISRLQSDSIIAEVTAALPLGERYAKLEFLTNDDLIPVTNIDLLCKVISPIISLTTKRIDFGDIDLDYQKDTVISISNTGNSILKITKIIIDGPNTTDFSFAIDPIPFCIDINESKKINISFKPKSTSEHVSRIAIASNDPYNPESSIILHGKGLKTQKPRISLSSNELNFGFLNINESRKSCLVINNNGPENLVIDSLYLSGSHKKFFNLDLIEFPQIIKPFDSVTICITFSPGSTDSIYKFNSVLKILSNDQLSPEIDINLCAYTTINIINISDTLINFGKVIIFDTLERKFSILNPNDFEITIDSIYFDPQIDSPFSLRPSKLPVLDKYSKTDFSITFIPRNKKYYSTKLNIQSNKDTKFIKKVNIEGYTIAPVFSTKKLIDFGKINQDSNKTIKIIITNSGDAVLQIKSARLIGKDSCEFAFLNRTFPIFIFPDLQDTLYLTFYSKIPGKKSCFIKLNINDPFDPGEINISAESISKYLHISSPLNPVFSLSQNYPNPFNPTTRIEYTIPKNCFVNLILYNSLGQEITKLVNEHQPQGTYSIDWNPKELPGGIYYLKLSTPIFSNVKKLIYLK